QTRAFALHRQELYAAANPAQPKAAAMLEGVAEQMRAQGWRGDADQAALGQYKMYLDREALVMTFNDQFLFLTLALLLAAVGVWFMRTPRPRAPLVAPAPAAPAA